MNRYERILEETKLEFPKFRIVKKSESRFMKLLAFLLFFNRAFMTGFITTIGNTMYVPDGWDDKSAEPKASTLRHERVHLRQQKRYGMVVYVLMYLLWPIPFLFAKGRRDLEMEAYAESMRAYAEYYGPRVLGTRELREKMIGHFTSGEYGWMWVKRQTIVDWYFDTIERIRKNHPHV